MFNPVKYSSTSVFASHNGLTIIPFEALFSFFLSTNLYLKSVMYLFFVTPSGPALGPGPNVAPGPSSTFLYTACV
jgi:hypothetical protein